MSTNADRYHTLRSLSEDGAIIATEGSTIRRTVAPASLGVWVRSGRQ